MSIQALSCYVARKEENLSLIQFDHMLDVTSNNIIINAWRMHEGYCSQFVSLFVCVIVADLVTAYDACATN